MQRFTRTAAVAMSAALVLAAIAGPAIAACESNWSIVPSPNVGEAGGDFDNGLSSLAVVSPNDIWAVGNWGTYGAARSTLAMRWNGSTWTKVNTPNGPNEVNWLLSADAVASNDVWAVGYSATNPPEQSFRKTLIEHWNGAAWSVVPSPNPTPPIPGGPPINNELYGVAAVSANDVWAVGLSSNYTTGRTLILHWNGTSWTAVPSPSPGEYGWLRSISVVSANDIWAAGTYYNNGSQVTLILRWNGTKWNVVPSPNDGPFTQELFKIRAVSANDVWAVGYHLAVFGFNQVFQTSIFHWNGTTWSVVPSPDVNQLSNYLWSVDGTSATDAWAVGFYDTGFELKTMTQHWDGTAWTILPSPNDSTYITELTDVATISPTDVWAVGESTGFFTFKTLTMHRTGTCGGGSALHVSGIAPSVIRGTVKASVTIADNTGAPAGGAAVTVVITKPGGTQVTQTKSTTSAGSAQFSTASSGSGTYTFTVTNVAKTGFTYNSAANTETSDSITIP
jgi:hypothetical protein